MSDRRGGVEEIEVEEIPVKPPASFPACWTAAKTALERDDVFWRGGWLAGGRLRLQFVTGQETRIMNFGDGRDIRMIPWLWETEPRYWLGIVLVSRPEKGRQETERVTLAVAGGVAGPEYELLRAEWENYGKSDSEHAQPHWHIHGREPEEEKRNREASPFDDFEGGADGLEVGEAPVLGEKIHFAMAAGWHEGKYPGCFVNVTPERLHDWIIGCSKYTRRQLAIL